LQPDLLEVRRTESLATHAVYVGIAKNQALSRALAGSIGMRAEIRARNHSIKAVKYAGLIIFRLALDALQGAC
jgi:hypothetical protein